LNRKPGSIGFAIYPPLQRRNIPGSRAGGPRAAAPGEP